MANTLQIKRGTKATLPTLAAGELGFCTDTYEFYVGDGATNRFIGSPSTVTGPASATDNAIARFDGTTGKIVQNSGVTIDDNRNILLDKGHLKFTQETAPTALTCALAGLGAGNVDNGTHYYKVTFVTANGETEAGTASLVVTVADKTVNGQVALSAIPIGTSGVVTSRKIYRTKAGIASTGIYYLLTTIADNTTTTYTDNIADASLTTAHPIRNTTAGGIYVGGNNRIQIDQNGNIGVNETIHMATTNTFIGKDAGLVNEGTKNTFIGNEAGKAHTTGVQNTFIGSEAGTSNTTGDSNIFIGLYSGWQNTTASESVFMGISSGRGNVDGFQNTFIGNLSGYSNISGNYNTFLGSGSGYSNTASDNTFLGLDSGRFNSSGNGNTHVGYDSAIYGTTGSNNCVVGRSASLQNVTGSFNSVFGSGAAKGVTTNSHSNNCIFGYYGANLITTGSNNILIGYKVADNLTTGSNNIIIGYDLNASAVDVTNELNIGGAIKGDLSTKVIYLRAAPRVGTVASSATPTPDGDANDMFTVTALAQAATFGVPAGTPVNGQKLMIRVLDNGTARALAWNAIYVARGVALPTTTVISKYLYVGFIYNSAASKWDCVASSQEE